MPRLLNKIILFFKESKTELAKVVWPSRPELFRHTYIVIIFSLAVAVFLGFIDYLLIIALRQLF